MTDTDTRRTLTLEPLSAETFRPYGEVIAAGTVNADPMNDARFERYDDLARLTAEGRVGMSIARCRRAASQPVTCPMVERHPRGSQAFVPLAGFRFVVVVAPAGAPPSADDLRAFLTDGSQGVNYRAGTWHVPLIGLAAGQNFLIIDDVASADNCDSHTLDRPVVVPAVPALPSSDAGASP
ncbi:ureidoglycolate lyase [Lentisalinibacter sediminis]|uniref:ureidoglycolate lyase n=1 Tax=Lentisalinibacter sediminis TaxID=2992237 RepID=UPI00386C0C8F